MTILNIYVQSDRALIGMDTAVFNTSDSSVITSSKFGLLPDSDLFIGWRGDRTLGANVFAECFAARCYVDYDIFLPQIPALIIEKIRSVREMYENMRAPRDVLDDPHMRSLQLALVGWSAAGCRMKGTVFTKDSDTDSVEVSEVAESLLMPGDFLDPTDIEVPSSVAAMERVSRAQFQFAERLRAPGFGGTLLLIELEHGQVKIRRRSIFPK